MYVPHVSPLFCRVVCVCQMRALIAFLGARPERLASLRGHLPALLRIGDDDKDEWVQVVSGLVRSKLLPTETDALGSGGSGDNVAAATTQDPAIYSSAVLSKTVTEVLERAQRIMSERRGNGEPVASGGGGGGGIRHVMEAPYFGPLEERYVSRKQQPPRKEFANAHFRAKYDFLNEFTEDLASHVGSASNASASTTGTGSAATAAQGARAGQGGSSKPSGSSAPQSASAGPNLAQARRVSLAATDPAVGSDGLRRTSKPLALSRNHAGLQPGATGAQFGSRKSSAGAGSARGMRAGSGGGGGGKAGLMMINVDELQAIHADKLTAREKAKGKPGRKKAKVEAPDERRPAGDGQPPPSSVSGDGSNGTGRTQDEASTNGKGKAAELEEPAKPSAPPSGPMPVPQQGEIDAMAAMIVLGVAGGGDGDAKTSYLPESLTQLLENANSLRPDGKAKLESFFQKRTPEGSPQERVKYHEEVSEGADGELARVTSYIRLDYETWVWDRVHKKKRVRS